MTQGAVGQLCVTYVRLCLTGTLIWQSRLLLLGSCNTAAASCCHLQQACRVRRLLMHVWDAGSSVLPFLTLLCDQQAAGVYHIYQTRHDTIHIVHAFSQQNRKTVRSVGAALPLSRRCQMWHHSWVRRVSWNAPGVDVGGASQPFCGVCVCSSLLGRNLAFPPVVPPFSERFLRH